MHEGRSSTSVKSVRNPKPQPASPPEHRTFVIGVSADTAPFQRGGWRATKVETST